MAPGVLHSPALNTFPLTAEAADLSRLPLFTVPSRVLVAQSDPENSRTLAAALASSGFEVSVVAHGRDIVPRAITESFALILVDAQLAGVDSLRLGEELREHGITAPAVFVTAVHGMEYRIGDSIVELSTGKATRNGIRFTLTARELQLLRYLIQHRGRTVSRQELLREVWGYSSTQTRTVDVHVATLRQKLKSVRGSRSISLPFGVMGTSFGRRPRRAHNRPALRAVQVGYRSGAPSCWRIRDACSRVFPSAAAAAFRRWGMAALVLVHRPAPHRTQDGPGRFRHDANRFLILRNRIAHRAFGHQKVTEQFMSIAEIRVSSDGLL